MTDPGQSLVTIAGDGTFRPPRPAAEGAAEEDPRLATLTRLRSLLGDDLEGQIATRLFLPSALGTEPADHFLPASLTLLGDATGDLASYGWRIGPGLGKSWRRAQELGERMLDAARIALFGYEGPLQIAALGPASLAAATFLGSGERTLADRGALRDLPQLLAEGILGRIGELATHVPAAEPHLLIREDHLLPVLRGTVPTPSGYRRYPAVPAAEIGPWWRSLLTALTEAELDPAHVTWTVEPRPEVLRAARDAGAQRLAVVPDRLGVIGSRADRARWEGLADLHEAGTGIELLIDPPRVEQQLDAFAAGWRELGYGETDLAGLTLIAHRGDGASVGAGVDPAQEPGRASLLGERAVEQLLRAAPAWAERVQR